MDASCVVETGPEAVDYWLPENQPTDALASRSSAMLLAEEGGYLV